MINTSNTPFNLYAVGETEAYIEIPVPGAELSQLDIQITDNLLTVTYDPTLGNVALGAVCECHEWTPTKFEMLFDLELGIVPTESNLLNGVLNITLKRFDTPTTPTTRRLLINTDKECEPPRLLTED